MGSIRHRFVEPIHKTAGESLDAFRGRCRFLQKPRDGRPWGFPELAFFPFTRLAGLAIAPSSFTCSGNLIGRAAGRGETPVAVEPIGWQVRGGSRLWRRFF